MSESPLIPFDNSYGQLGPGFFTRLRPTAVKDPSLIAWNQDLADLLGVSSADVCELSEVFSGNVLPLGSDPLAQLYAGHQFGQYNPQLGDGRALLLGEVIGRDGVRRDIQLKGSGPTPYSRMGDGRAWLGPVLREYVVSEAMHSLGIPTTRALAAVSTGELVYREQGALPGAVLTRVAQSHIRVGTFQVFAQRGELTHLNSLTNYAIARHYPQVSSPFELLSSVIVKQSYLIAKWMSVGFIHGVMNTDNCLISGETIDYGPCAFMDAYHQNRVFSSIDQYGRYAFSNQPHIAVWNMAQFATALIQLSDNKTQAIDQASEIVHQMPELVNAEWIKGFAAKLGISEPASGDEDLANDLLTIMQDCEADFTNTFSALRRRVPETAINSAKFPAWYEKWKRRTENLSDCQTTMELANPLRIPRNHRIEQMIEAAVAGDFGPFERLMQGLSEPYKESPEYKDLESAPDASEIVSATFCGT